MCKTKTIRYFINCEGKESLGWYKNDISDFILQCAEEMGIHTSLDEVGSPETNQDQNFMKK